MRLRIFLFLLCLVNGLSLAAQTELDYTPLANRLADYGKLTMNWDIEGLLDMTAPALFDIVPRATIREQMYGLQSDEDMEVTFHDFIIDRIGKAVERQGEAFSPVECHHGITFKLRSERYRSPEFAGRMVRMLEKSYPEVRFDAANHVIEVMVPKSLYAIRASPSDDWYFVEYRPENAALMDLVVPPTVREQLK